MSLERQADHADNPWWGEHIHRYREAIKLISPGSKVLDIACGNGFGSMLLAEHGCDVYGADISEEAVRLSAEKYKHAHLQFLKADATALPFTDGYFDVVVSFETIEHSGQYNEMLSEFKRVVNRKGKVVISTPNILVNSPSGKIENPFHTQEWNYEQLLDLLSRVYPMVELFGQKYTRYSENNFRKRLAHLTENILYLRGIRKLPLSFQNGLMNIVGSTPMYPRPEDYALVSSRTEAEKCKTFFAVCRNE